MANDLQTKLDAILLDKNTNLLPENLKKGVTLLGVEGNLEEGSGGGDVGIDTYDATATSDDLIAPATAYVKGTKIYGSIQKTEELIGEPSYNTNLDVMDNIPYNTLVAINNNDILVSLDVVEKVLYFHKVENDNTYSLLHTDDVLFANLDTGGQSQRLTISDCYFDGNNFDCIMAYSPAQGDGKINPISFAKFSYIDGIYSCRQIEPAGNFVNDDTYHDNMVRFITDATGTYLIRIYGIKDEPGAYIHLCVYRVEHTYNSSIAITQTLHFTEKMHSSFSSSFIERIVQLNVSTLSTYTKLVCLSYTGKTDTSTSSNTRIYKEMCILLSTDCSSVVNFYGYNDGTATNTTQYRANRFCTIGGLDMYAKISLPSSSTMRVSIYKIDPNNGDGMDSAKKTNDLRTSITGNRLNIYATKDMFIICVSTSDADKKHLFHLYELNHDTGVLTLIKTSDTYAPADYFAESFNIHQVINNTRFIAVTNSGVYSIHYTDEGRKTKSLEFVDGTKLYNTDDTNATADKILIGQKVYNNSGKITGTMPDNGKLSYEPNGETQTIPAGYTSGGTIGAIKYDELGTITPEEYDEINEIAEDVLGGVE